MTHSGTEHDTKQRYDEALLQYQNLYNQNLQLQQELEVIRKIEEDKQKSLQDALDLKI